ncbi:MAG TPA: ATP-binding protein [Bacteroidales bacterium]|nr:ATP-binding protein [Bacteroidales bacterium]
MRFTKHSTESITGQIELQANWNKEMKDLSLHILDIAQNSIVAGATEITISIREELQANRFVIEVKDNGSGMSPEVLQRVADPYYTTRSTRKVGLGIPLLKQNAEVAGGSLRLSSQPGEGTTLVAAFGHNHIDRPPLGDIAGVVVLLAGANPETRFTYVHKVENKQYVFDTREIAEVLEGLPLSDASVARLLKELINENLSSINAG